MGPVGQSVITSTFLCRPCLCTALFLQDFLLEDAQVAAICEPLLEMPVVKRARVQKDMAWKATHEEVYAAHGLTWPPMLCEELAAFPHRRQGEVADIADKLFKPAKVGSWEWFDTNHTVERSLRWPVPEGSEIHNPWKPRIPTMTALTSMVGRKVTLEGKKVLHHLHGLEAMSLIGWDLGFWKGGESPFGKASAPNITPELLQDLAGNAWSAFAFTPIAIAAFGAVPWSCTSPAPARQQPATLPKFQTAPMWTDFVLS